jgi:DNA-binding transcriptional LysR family regulator
MGDEDRRSSYSRKMLICDITILVWQWMTNMQMSDRIGRRMKLHDLHVLMAVAEAGSMSQAAKLLNTTQPAISKSIADLEDAIGVRLLDRGRRGAEPTQYGRVLVDRGVAVFDDLRQAVKHIEFLADPTAGEVRVGTHNPIAPLIPAMFDKLHKTHPGISVHLTTVPTDPQQFRLLRERKIDLLLGRMTPPDEEDIDTEVLYHDWAIIVAGPNSKWVHRRRIALSELASESWCLPSVDRTIGRAVADAFRERSAAFPPKGVVWGAATFMGALIHRGPYLSVFPASLLRFDATLPKLKVLPVDLPVPPWAIGVMTLKNRTLTPAVKLFIEYARAVTRPLAKKPESRKSSRRPRPDS